MYIRIFRGNFLIKKGGNGGRLDSHHFHEKRTGFGSGGGWTEGNLYDEIIGVYWGLNSISTPLALWFINGSVGEINAVT